MQPRNPEPEVDPRCRCWLHVRVVRDRGRWLLFDGRGAAEGDGVGEW
jgi:hypothetical protein